MGRGAPQEGVVAATVVVTFDRPDYLERSLASLAEVHGRDPGNRCVKFLSSCGECWPGRAGTAPPGRSGTRL